MNVSQRSQRPPGSYAFAAPRSVPVEPSESEEKSAEQDAAAGTRDAEQWTVLGIPCLAAVGVRSEDRARHNELINTTVAALSRSWLGGSGHVVRLPALTVRSTAAASRGWLSCLLVAAAALGRFRLRARWACGVACAAAASNATGTSSGRFLCGLRTATTAISRRTLPRYQQRQ